MLSRTQDPTCKNQMSNHTNSR